MKEKLELRKKIKSKKPNFIREDYHKKKAVSKSWRGPRGLHSKMRHGFQGHRRTLEVGYGSPAEVKYLHKSGLFPIVVCNLAEISKINKTKQAAVISATVGTRKKVELVNKAKELGIKVINVKDIDAYLNNIQENLKKKQTAKEKTAKEKATKQKEKEKKAEEKKKKEEKESPEDAKKKQNKELEKVLTKREQ